MALERWGPPAPEAGVRSGNSGVTAGGGVSWLNDGRGRSRTWPLDCQPGAWLGDVAQLVEHLLCKQGVGGSSPLVSTKEVFCV